MSSTNGSRRRLRRPGHSTLVAYLALFLALSTGGAYAASKIGAGGIKDNAIHTRHILNGDVRAADLHEGSVKTPKLAENAVTGAKLAENAVTGAKVADNALTGADVDESTLAQVPDSAALAGKLPSAFLARTVYKKESTVGPGTRLGDNTNVANQACDGGDVLLSGGPANISATSKLLESFPSPGTTNSWSARINDNGTADSFSVVILCIDQTP